MPLAFALGCLHYPNIEFYAYVELESSILLFKLNGVTQLTCTIVYIYFFSDAQLIQCACLLLFHSKFSSSHRRAHMDRQMVMVSFASKSNSIDVHVHYQTGKKMNEL